MEEKRKWKWNGEGEGVKWSDGVEEKLEKVGERREVAGRRNKKGLEEVGMCGLEEVGMSGTGVSSKNEWDWKK
ncbi:hypothetical protein Pmani_038809 [Petrolisthes manimaculis]|uniref:Uncharacterized protein n=1 Tax=Petrolisthes manimaculis TaxID=1843537 RepID=A0AAE1NEX7_9EUCA|nr:hypothetical protein Pmani_038809 [Petrolisthes manimaculis]